MTKKECIAKMFDNIATDYDKLTHILSLNIDKLWKKKAVKEVCDFPQGESFEVIDLACGTGDFAIEVAKHCGQECRITGVDISPKMIEMCRKKLHKTGMEGRIDAQEGDCEKLDFSDKSFDRVCIAFGVRNLEHIEAGLMEMRRILKTGGKVVILELSVPKNPCFKAIYNLYFAHIMPFIGGMLSGDMAAYKYLPISVLNFPKPEEFLQMMQSCGFSEVKMKGFSLGICRMYTGFRA